MDRYRNTPAAVSRSVCRIALLAFIAWPATAVPATDPVRVWVDSTGSHAVKATLIEVKDEKAVLITPDGRRISIPIDKLSTNDQEYIEEVGKSDANVLRTKVPEPPNIEPLEPLDLPPAASVADQGAVLDLSAADSVAAPTELPPAIPPDRSPTEVPIATQQIQLGEISSHEACSHLIPVGDAQSPALGMSVSSESSSYGEESAHRLLRFDATTSAADVIWQDPDRIRLHDHHVPSGRSLVSVGHNALGRGGQLAIATGWDRDAISIADHRSLPDGGSFGRSSHLRWAKMIDDEHCLAIIDDTLIAANVISGKTLYRIEGIDKKSVPALSGGRRLVAVPMEGSVDLYRTPDGDALGRIRTGSSIIPAVSFSNLGDALAIITPRRMRVWSLPDAALRADLETLQSLGSGPPIWIDSDLVMSSSGVLLSIFRGIPVWRYGITGAVASYVGGNVAILRRRPTTLHVVSLPHPGAISAMNWIDSVPTATGFNKWRVPGRSTWGEDGWTDRDVRISAQPRQLR